MSRFIIPQGYVSPLSIYRTQTAIGELKRIFEDELTWRMGLKRVSAPLFVDPSTGLNDDLNGVERAVTFDIKETGGTAAVVHSLAKWKRMALKKYGFRPMNGLYTDMNAIRRDEEMDNLHSIYVDQWDWEMVIDREHRNEEFLRQTVNNIVSYLCATERRIHGDYPELGECSLSPDVSFVTTQQLEDAYPALTPKERENEYLREHHTAFIMKIGGKLKSGERHDGRAPDYDDWTLNGDIMFWNDTLGCAFEVSSMGIRVDAAALDRQLTEAGCDDRRSMPFHSALLADELPLTIGGGIGQSRVSMLLLRKAHVGEVQVSIWDAETVRRSEEAGIVLL